MAVVVVSGPAAAVSTEEAKVHLQVGGTGEDGLITAMVAAAQGTIDGPSGWLGRSIGVQTLRTNDLRSIYSPAGFALPYGPVRSVGQFSIGGTAVSPDTYSFADGILRQASGASWNLCGSPGASVTYDAGYDVDKVPAPIKMAILLMVQDLYLKRKRDPGLIVDTVIGVGSRQFSPTASSTLTDTTKALLAPFRVWSL